MNITKKTLQTTRKITYLTLGKYDEFRNNEADIVILCYHSVSNDKWDFSISLKMLEKQLKYLKKTRKAITLSDVSKYLDGKKEVKTPSFVVTFDDGYENVLDSVPLFLKYKIKPTIFILSNPKKANRSEMDNRRKLLSKKQVQFLIDNKWEIGVHSATHINLSKVNGKELVKQIIESKQKIENQIGKKVKFFAYPNGNYNYSAVETVKKAGYEMALSMNDEVLTKNINKFTVPRSGVVKSHSFTEFKYNFSPTVVKLRNSKVSGNFKKILYGN